MKTSEFKENNKQIAESIIKMDNKTVRELRDITKEQNFRGSYKLRKDDLILFLSEPSTQEMPAAPPKKILEVLGIDGEPAGHSKGTILQLLENCKKSGVKHSIEKPFLLFVNLSTTFCCTTRLYIRVEIPFNSLMTEFWG